MKRWISSVVAFVLSLTACGTATANREATAPASSADAAVSASPSSVASEASSVLFQDTFDDDRNRWGVVDDPVGGTTSYESGDYVWAFKGSMAHWLPEVLGEQYDRGDLQMRDVAVEAALTIDDGGGVAGVACRENTDTDAAYQWYEFIARDGYAAIRQADAEGNIEVLTETDAVELPRAKAFTIEGVCADDASGNARLTLRIDDRQLLTTSRATPLGNGVPSLQAWTYPIHAPMQIRWHDFTVRAATA